MISSSDFSKNYAPKTPFNVTQTIARSLAGTRYQESLIDRSRSYQYLLSKNSQAITNAQTLINQTWRTASLHYASLVATINDLIR